MIRFFAGHPTAAFLLALAFTIAGLVALPGLQRETFPDFRSDRIEIRVFYPGATAEEVEEAICLAVEDALDAVPGIDQLTCTARSNVGILEIEALHGADVARLLTDVKTEIDAIDTFPAEVERPQVRQLDVTEPVVTLALSGPMDAPDLRSLAEEIRIRLRDLSGVAEVTVGGFSERRLEVALDERRLRALGLSVSAVAQAVERQSLDLPAGSIETGARDIVIRFADRRRSAEALADLVLRETAGGAAIRLGDVATIREGFVDPALRTLHDGAQAAMIGIRRDREADALRVLAAVEAFVEAERERLPPTVTLSLTQDTSSLIADRLEMLAMNALQGFALICLVLWTFFSIRFSLTVAAALPLSLLASVFVLDALGFNLNLISTVGLLIAVGLLIDSAIVINENIARHAAGGLPPLAAARNGVAEVSGAVIAAFLTSVAVFAPLAFLEGTIGRVLLVLPIVLIVTLSTALVVSFLVLPRFAARALAGARRHPLRARIDTGFDALRDRLVGRAVAAAIAWRYLSLGLVGLAFLGALALLAGGTVKFQAFPDIEGDIVEARLMMVPGTPAARTAGTVDRLVAALDRVGARHAEDHPDDPPLIRAVTIEYGRNPDTADQGGHLATIRADLLGSERRAIRIATLLDAWREEAGLLTDIVSLTFKEPTLGPAGRAIEIRLTGADFDRLQRAGADLVGALARYDGVVDLTTDLHAGPDEIRLVLREGAGRLGVDASTVATQLRATLQGLTVDEIRRGGETVRIDLRLDAGFRSDLGRLDDFVVTLDDGRAVPLAAVTVAQAGRGLALIPRIDGRRTLTVAGDVDTARGNANEILAALTADFAPRLAADHPGIAMSFEGQAAAQAETGGSMRRVFAIGLAAMFIILSFQFRAYVEPVIVMLAIPMALTGVVAGHWLMGLDMSMPSLVGFVSLAGIVVNNSILLVAFIRQRLDAGEAIDAAARAASLDRFRAIFITTATTVAGLVPLLFETSVQAQVLIPLVTSLAFGLVTATVLVLLLVPALYVMLADLRGAGTGRRAAAPTPSRAQ